MGDTGVSTEAAVTGLMSESGASESSSGVNPYFAPAPAEEEEENLLLGGKKQRHKHKTTLRKKNIYFTKDDFIAF
jgi:hypothetical protein